MVKVLQLGRQPYRETLALQRGLHARVAAGVEPDTWLVVEHDPVITLGRNARHENILTGPEALAASGIEVVEIERGGDVTYHGPGQLVVYPIVRLTRFREVVPFVSALEDAVIRALATYGVDAEKKSDHRGVYVRNDAICAIGLAVRQMTTLHGLALNVETALDYDCLITPCGTSEYGITSISRELGRPIELSDAREAILHKLEQIMGIDFEVVTTTHL